MFETGRRSATSTSELGLYSDRSDLRQESQYSLTVRKYVIGVMMVLAVILAAIFFYDFTSGTSVNSKASQEIKRIYILQNARRRPNDVSQTAYEKVTSGPDIGVNETEIISMQDRSDDDRPNDRQDLDVPEDPAEDRIATESRSSHRMATVGTKLATENIHNLKLRKRILVSLNDNGKNKDEVEGKQLFDDHDAIYPKKHRYEDLEEEEATSFKESRPMPFHFELKTPHPTSFKRPIKYPQLSQYRYPLSSRNIQDIIKYLTNNAEVPNRAGVKFAGVYVNSKKYDYYPDIGETMSNSDRSEEDEDPSYSIAFNGDPFYRYKPKHPADVNLLATSNVRFSPSGINRYNPYYDSFSPARIPINFNKLQMHAPAEIPYDTDNYFGNRRKAKPFSVMLDIYPITDIAYQKKKASRPSAQSLQFLEEYDQRKSTLYNRGNKFHLPTSQHVPAPVPPSQQGSIDDDVKRQMILHLNLYPRRKNKLNRQDIVQNSETMLPEEQERFVEEILSPFDSIAKQLTDHAAIQKFKFEEKSDIFKRTNSPTASRYQENILNKENEDKELISGEESSNVDFSSFNKPEPAIVVPSNHRPNYDKNYAITEKYSVALDKIMVNKSKGDHRDNCGNSTSIEADDSRSDKNGSKVDTDSSDGLEDFANGLLAID